jgi:hypothetical protein
MLARTSCLRYPNTANGSPPRPSGAAQPLMQCAPAAPQRPPLPSNNDLGLERFPAHAVVAREPNRLYLQLACLPSRRASVPVLGGRRRRQVDPFCALASHQHQPGLSTDLQDPAGFLPMARKSTPSSLAFSQIARRRSLIVVADLQLAAGGTQQRLAVRDPHLEATVGAGASRRPCSGPRP